MAVVAALLLASVGRADLPRYHVTPLRPFQTAHLADTLATSINDAGIVVGVSYAQSFNPMTGFYPDRVATIWDADGVGAELFTRPSGYEESIPTAINNSGKSAGILWSFNGTPAPRAAHTTTNGWQSLGSGKLFDINDAGRMVGTRFGEAIFRDGNTIITLADPATSTDSVALAVSEAGLIVGYARESSDLFAPKSAVRFIPGGAAHILATDVGRAEARDINRSGLIVGFADALWNAYYDSASRAVIFENGSVTRLPLPQDGTNVQSWAEAVNDAGVIVGYSQRGTNDHRATAWFQRQVVDLQSRINPASAFDLFDAVSVNNRGQIAASAYWDHDANPSTPLVYQAVRLDPIRSPGDTNYDDVVDFADLLTLAQHYGQSGNGNVFYETGDFNFDWSVDFTDLLTIAQHYDAAASFASDWAVAQSLVPEPATMGACGIAFCRRRRR